MRGIRPRAAGPFSDARKGTKSAHKGEAPLCIPRKDARLWLGGKDTHVTARPDLFFAQTGPLTRPRPRRKTPLHCARTGRASLPGWGTRGGVADPSPVRRILPERRAQARFGLKAREAMGVVLVGIPKQHAPHPPYVSPGRVPAFGWVEKTRMSQPAPTCFLSRQAPLARPGLCRKTPLHCARPGWACQLAGEGHTGRGHCPLARKAHPARASRVSALRAESPRSEGRCFGREPKTTCAR